MLKKDVLSQALQNNIGAVKPDPKLRPARHSRTRRTISGNHLPNISDLQVRKQK